MADDIDDMIDSDLDEQASRRDDMTDDQRVSIKDESKSHIIYRLLKNSMDARRVMIREGRELAQFTSRRRGPENTQHDKIDFWAAKVARTDEAIEIFGPYLYQQSPTRVVTAEEGATPEALAEIPCTEKLLNKGQRLTKANWHNKKSVRSGIQWGRGILKTGLSRAGCAASKSLHVTDYLEDPDATCPEDVSWAAGRRFVKRSKLKRQMPKMAAQINNLTKYADLSSDVESADTNASGKFDDGSQSRNGSNELTNEQRFYHTPEDLIEVYDVYMTVGLANFKGGTSMDNIENADGTRSDLNGDENKNVKIDNSPKKYTVAWQGGKAILLRESEWEIPFWRINEFPFSKLEFVEDDELMTPKSPLYPGIGWQYAINDLTQLALSKSRFNLRDIFVILRKYGITVEQDEWLKIVDGDDQEVINISADDPKAKLDDIYQQVQPTPISSEFERILGLCLENYQRATGLYDILYTGQTATQSRSASESKIRQQRSLSRIEEMRFRVEEWADNVSAKEAFTNRFLLDREDVSKIVGEELGSLWRDLLPPLEEHTKQVYGQFVEQYPNLDMNNPQVVKIIQQTVMMQRAQGVTFDEWVNQYSFNIVSDSMRRKDRDEQISLSDTLMNQTLSAVAGMQTPDSMRLVAGIIVFSMEARGAEGELLDIAKQMAQGVDMQSELIKAQQRAAMQQAGAPPQGQSVQQSPPVPM